MGCWHSFIVACVLVGCAVAWPAPVDVKGVLQLQADGHTRLSLQLPELNLGATLHAVTAGLIKAGASNQTLLLSPLSRQSRWWVHESGGCSLRNNSCVFESLAPLEASQLPISAHEHWNDVTAADFYLKGAGLAWLSDVPEGQDAPSGCWMAATFLAYSLRPSPALQEVIDELMPKLPSRKLACCTFASHGACEAHRRQADVVQATHSSAHCQFDQQWCQKHWQQLGHVARKAVTYHACATHGSHIIGSVEHTDAKVLTLLALSATDALPTIHPAAAGPPVWNDAMGFASCTSEELFKEQQAHQINGTRFWALPTRPREPYAIDVLPSNCTGCPCVARDELFNLSLHAQPQESFLASAYQTDFSTCQTLDQVMAQTEDSYQGPICCGFGSSSGLLHARVHPTLQRCKLVVYTFVGYKKDWLHQPAALDPNITAPPAQDVCFVAFMDPETAVFHGIRPDMGSGAPLPRLKQWHVVTLLNTPWWNTQHHHFSPRRIGKAVKLLGHRLFPNAPHMMWIDGKFSSLRQDPRLIMQWAFGNSTSVGLLTFAHPDRKDGWEELQLEQFEMPAWMRPNDHQANLAVVEDLFKRYQYPRGQGLLESAVLILRITPDIQKLLCLWWMLTHLTTARDQFLFEFVLWKMQYNRKGLHRRERYACMRSLSPHNGHLTEVVQVQ